MKTLLIATNILFLSIIIYQSCAPTKAVVNAATCPPCKSYAGVPFPGLTTNTAIMISKNYKTMNQPLLALQHGTVPDANSIWFSLETLKSFIWNIENAACQKGCYNSTNNLNLGVRIYYARYPDDDSMNNNQDLLVLPHSTPNSAVNNSFAEHHTIFMVPTFRDANNPNTQWDFDPWHWSSSATTTNSCTVPTTMAQWLVDTTAPFGNARSLMLAQTANYPAGSSQITGYNHGDMIPPGNGSVAGPGF